MRVLVVDDEALACDRLQGLFRRAGVTEVDRAPDVRSALDLLSQADYQAAFVDVGLPGRSGLELAREIHPLPVVFVTGHTEFAPAAFDLDAVDFLLKPVSEERLRDAIARVKRRLTRVGAPSAPLLRVRDRGRTLWIDPRDVHRFTASHKYTSTVVGGREVLLEASLDALEEKLAPLGFFRVHRAEVIALGSVRSLEKRGSAGMVRLADGSEVRVSRRYLPRLRRALNAWRTSSSGAREGGLRARSSVRRATGQAD